MTSSHALSPMHDPLPHMAADRSGRQPTPDPAPAAPAEIPGRSGQSLSGPRPTAVAGPPLKLSPGLLTTLQEDHVATAAPPPEEQAHLNELKARDREVRAHEQAHASTGGVHAGPPSYELATGPDGRQYAVGGSVKIDVAPVAGDPAATIAKMQQVIDAALAPVEPSAQDRAVAATAARQLAEAEAESRRMSDPEAGGAGDTGSDPASPGAITNLLA